VGKGEGVNVDAAIGDGGDVWRAIGDATIVGSTLVSVRVRGEALQAAANPSINASTMGVKNHRSINLSSVQIIKQTAHSSNFCARCKVMLQMRARLMNLTF
jgi:hypothetical protein